MPNDRRIETLSTRGQRLAHRYELERELNAESQGRVWQALDTALDRRVEVRLLDPELARDAAAAERFWQAVRTAARSSRVGEPRILDGGTDEATGQAFVVHEWRDEPVVAPVETVPGPWRRTGVRALPGWPVDPRYVVAVGGLVAALAVAGWLAGAGASAWLAWVNEPLGRPAQSVTLAPAVGAQPGQPTSVAGTAPPTLAAARPLQSEATPVPTATDTGGGGEARRIVNTDGLGVALRASPGGDRLPGQGYAEGSVVTVFEQQGAWARIRGADGRTGWVLAVTLAPTDGALPAATPVRPTALPSAATPAPATPSAAASGRQRVVNTDGQGVALRGAPEGERLPGKGYAEGTKVTVLERSGAWTHIRGDDGRDGWVPTVTLAPS